MLNIDEFIKRLQTILNYYGLSAANFADKIGIQRSSLSHLLSGRNNPSLDLIMKIVENFPEVDMYWIVNGKGEFPKTEVENKIAVSSPTPNFKNTQTDLFENANLEVKDSTLKNPIFENLENIFPNTRNLEGLKNDVEIEQIVIFYKNGTFKYYLPE